MKNKPKVSIIVPVYNVEDYLKRCYESIAAQTYEHWETILVDDGSTDRSGLICNEIAEKDKRVKVIHKENEGLGLTRNCGVRNANGDYVFFLDSDDYIEPDAIEILLSLNEDRNCDMVIGNFFYQEQVTEIPISTGLYEGKEIDREIVARIIGSEPGKTDQLTPSSCGKLYRKSIFVENDIWFPSERVLIWEDLAFNFKYMRSCSRIYLSDRPIYHYCFNGDSVTHRYDPQKLNKVMKMYRYMRNQINKTQTATELIDRLNNNFLGHIRTCFKLESFYDKQNGQLNTIKKIKSMCQDKDVLNIIEQYDPKYYNRSQRILSKLIYQKKAFLVYALCKAQNRRKRIE